MRRISCQWIFYISVGICNKKSRIFWKSLVLLSHKFYNFSCIKLHVILNSLGSLSLHTDPSQSLRITLLQISFRSLNIHTRIYFFIELVTLFRRSLFGKNDRKKWTSSITFTVVRRSNEIGVIDRQLLELKRWLPVQTVFGYKYGQKRN